MYFWRQMWRTTPCNGIRSARRLANGQGYGLEQALAHRRLSAGQV